MTRTWALCQSAHPQLWAWYRFYNKGHNWLARHIEARNWMGR